ncbi:MAG: RNA 2',3'-cyclic phosphodiesterase [Candidatus Omnitrophica bacterium]|nr:RNA 2',3'-cyclic phosphodiesterase [Candidatus Omnitrophota bacterium]
MRAFIGIGLSEEARAALTVLQQELSKSHADVKWVDAEQLHVTLKFLDEITEAQRQQVEGFLMKIAQHTSAFTMGLQELGAFPSLNDPRIIWVGVSEGKNDVIRLADAIEKESRALGLKKEEWPYSAHATIGRVRSPRGKHDFIEGLRNPHWTPPTAWQATSVTLYQSVLTSAGPTHSVLAEIPLSK